jgi:hypothetical protein
MTMWYIPQAPSTGESEHCSSIILGGGLLTVSCSGMSNVTCSYYLLATDVYDQAPLTNYWCDSITETGGIIYEVTPDGRRLSRLMSNRLANHHRLRRFRIKPRDHYQVIYRSGIRALGLNFIFKNTFEAQEVHTCWCNRRRSYRRPCCPRRPHIWSLLLPATKAQQCPIPTPNTRSPSSPTCTTTSANPILRPRTEARRCFSSAAVASTTAVLRSQCSTGATVLRS